LITDTEYIMTNLKKVAAGFIVGAGISAAPLVGFAAPAFAATNGDVAGATGSHTQHVLVNSGSAGQSNASHLLVSYATPGSLRDGNAARCGGGINC
jgi:hypothetical protein